MRTLLSLPPPGLLFYHEIADEQRVDPGRVKAANGIARRTNQRIGEEVETGVIQHGKPSGLSGRMQQLVVEGIIVLKHSVNANRTVAHHGSFKSLAIDRPHAANGGKIARIGSGLEILAGDLGRYGCGKFPEMLTVLDEEVQILGRVRVERRRKDTAITERAGSKLHTALHPGDDFFRIEIADRGVDHFASSHKITEAQLAILEELLDLFAVVAGPEAQIAQRSTLLLAHPTIPRIKHSSQRRTRGSSGWLHEYVLRLLERADEQRVQRQPARETKFLTASGHAQDYALDGPLKTSRERRMHL